VLAVFAGTFTSLPGAKTQFTPLLQTGTQTGTVAYDEIVLRDMFSSRLNPNRRVRATKQNYVLAAQIKGDAPASPAQTQPASGGAGMNVILVSDIDMLYSVFFAMRSRGRDENDPIDLQLDNVAFVLNTLDQLAGDDRFIELRKRRLQHRTLTAVEEKTQSARDDANKKREEFADQFEAKQAEERQRLEDKLNELRQRQGVDVQQMLQEVANAQEAGQKRLDATIKQLEKERDQETERIERDLALQVRSVQYGYKLAAIALPPILPLALAGFVFARRRAMENIGVPKARLK
jgi:ABC-2 type transport system permease protein